MNETLDLEAEPFEMESTAEEFGQEEAGGDFEFSDEMDGEFDGELEEETATAAVGAISGISAYGIDAIDSAGGNQGIIVYQPWGGRRGFGINTENATPGKRPNRLGELG
jgi:hypothetical protein